MRKIGKEIVVTKLVSVKEIAIAEELSAYSINNNNKTIDVTVDFKSEELEVIDSENYSFESSDFKEEVTVEYLWELIDRERGLFSNQVMQ